MPISNRKFDHHVLNISNEKPGNSIISEDESSSDSEYAEHTDNRLKELVTGEEVYLVEDGKEIFKARYEETDEGFLVHGIPIQPGEGCFFVTKVMRNVVKWKNLNSDTMCQISAILWSKDELIRRSVPIIINKMRTEARCPTPTESRKRKREPENWKRNVMKKAYNSSQEYSHVVNKADESKLTKTIKKRELKPPFTEKCKLKCQDSFPEEVRRKIFSDFYSAGDKLLQSQQITRFVS